MSMIPARPIAVVAVWAVVAALGIGSAPSTRASVVTPLGGKAHRDTETGNRHYEERRYDDALRAYTEAQVAAPEEMPTRIPSLDASRRHPANASASLTVIIRSIKSRSTNSGMNPGLVPIMR